MRKEQTDVLIMGSGAAGMAAAIEACTGGARVILLEKGKNLGGISVTGMGIFAVESHHQKRKNVNFTKDDAFKLFMEETQWKADPIVVRNYVDKTADTIEWLEDMGVEFQLLDKLQYPSAINQTGHLVIPPSGVNGPGSTGDMVRKMTARATELGADIRNQATITDISHNAAGGYSVQWKDSDGNENWIEAKAVVIAAGGYVHDRELSARNHMEVGKNFNTANNIPLTGEGIRMAWKLGAVEDGMEYLYTSYIDAGHFPFSKQTQPLFNLMMFSFPYLWVNKRGERFVDEGNMNGAYMGNAIARQKDGTFYILFDADTVERVKTVGPDIWGYLDADELLDIDELFDLAIDRGADMLFRADSLEELAEKTGLPYETLQKTVDRYNTDCDHGHDTLFAKDHRYLRPVRRPKYYAVRRANSGYGTVGGIRIDGNAAAIGADCEPIPGLFAAGDCANGTISHNSAMMYTVWGGTLSFAVNSGRIAGESAAAFAKNSH